MRSQFTFYKSFDDVYQDLTDNQRLIFMKTLLDIQFLRIKIEDVSFEDKILNIVWKSIKHSLDTSISGFLNSQKKESVENPYFGVYDTLTKGVDSTLTKGVSEQDKGKEEVKEEVKEQLGLYDNFIKELKIKAPIKSKVTKTKEGKKLLKDIDDIDKLAEDYIQHQKDKGEFAKRITAFMEDYKTFHTKPVNNSVMDNIANQSNTVGGYFTR